MQNVKAISAKQIEAIKHGIKTWGADGFVRMTFMLDEFDSEGPLRHLNGMDKWDVLDQIYRETDRTIPVLVTKNMADAFMSARRTTGLTSAILRYHLQDDRWTGDRACLNTVEAATLAAMLSNGVIVRQPPTPTEELEDMADDPNYPPTYRDGIKAALAVLQRGE